MKPKSNGSVLTRGLKNSVLEAPNKDDVLDDETRKQLEEITKSRTPESRQSIASMLSPSSSSSIQTRTSGSIFELRQRLELSVWVQCDKSFCYKWRRVTKAELKDVGEDTKWFCSMNQDSDFASCDVPEEDTEWYDRAAIRVGLCYVKTCMPEGALVFAKMSGYCKWPGVLTKDPMNDLHCLEDVDEEPVWYHVEFLGGKHTHSWIKEPHVRLYAPHLVSPKLGSQPLSWRRGKQKLKGLKGKGIVGKHSRLLPLQRRFYKKKVSVDDAYEEANKLMPLSNGERIAKCRFNKSNMNENGEPDKARSKVNKKKENVKKKRSKVGGDKENCEPGKKRSKVEESESEEESDVDVEEEHVESDTEGSTISREKENGKREKSSREKESVKPKEKEKVSQKKENCKAEKDDIENKEQADKSKQKIKLTFKPKKIKKNKEKGNFGETKSEDVVQQSTTINDLRVTGKIDMEFPNSLISHSKEEKLVLDVQMYQKNERAFEHDVLRFMKRNNISFHKLPKWQNTSISLFQLFLAVHERGGYDEVCSKRGCWRLVYKELTECTNTGEVAKKYYKRNLYPYELFIKGKDFNATLPAARKKKEKKDKSSSSVVKSKVSKSVLPKEVVNSIKKELIEQGDSAVNSDNEFSLSSEKTINLMEMLGALENSEKMCTLEDDVLMGQNKLGIDITFFDESPRRRKDPQYVRDAISEFSEFRHATSAPDEDSQEVPQLSPHGSKGKKFHDMSPASSGRIGSIGQNLHDTSPAKSSLGQDARKVDSKKLHEMSHVGHNGPKILPEAFTENSLHDGQKNHVIHCNDENTLPVISKPALDGKKSISKSSVKGDGHKSRKKNNLESQKPHKRTLGSSPKSNKGQKRRKKAAFMPPSSAKEQSKAQKSTLNSSLSLDDNKVTNSSKMSFPFSQEGKKSPKMSPACPTVICEEQKSIKISPACSPLNYSGQKSSQLSPASSPLSHGGKNYSKMSPTNSSVNQRQKSSKMSPSCSSISQVEQKSQEMPPESSPFSLEGQKSPKNSPTSSQQSQEGQKALKMLPSSSLDSHKGKKSPKISPARSQHDCEGKKSPKISPASSQHGCEGQKSPKTFESSSLSSQEQKSSQMSPASSHLSFGKKSPASSPFSHEGQTSPASSPFSHDSLELENILEFVDSDVEGVL